MGSVETPETVGYGDDVMPLHAFDDTALNRIMAVTGLFRYNSVLDANLLRNSLTELLHIGDWKKLRGRLRLNVRIIVDSEDVYCFHQGKR
jgi:hypothetical protein